MRIPADAASVYGVLTDYDSYSEWAPPVAVSKLAAIEGELAIATFDLRRPKLTNLSVECIHTKNRGVMGRTIGTDVPATKWEWTIQPVDDTHSDVTLEFDGKADPRWLFPATRGLVDTTRWLQGLCSQMASFSMDVSATTEQGEILLEIMETADGMVCWVRGKKYLLKEV